MAHPWPTPGPVHDQSRPTPESHQARLWTRIKSGQSLDFIICDQQPITLLSPIRQTLVKTWTWINSGQRLDFATCDAQDPVQAHPKPSPGPPKAQSRPTQGTVQAHPRHTPSPPKAQSRPIQGPVQAHSSHGLGTTSYKIQYLSTDYSCPSFVQSWL